MKKYMNPGLVRTPNAALAAHSEAQRAALASLASATNAPKPAPTRTSPKKKPSTHTAHGIHGPAHSTSSRTHASSLAGTKRSSAVPSSSAAVTSAAAASARPDIGKYDGGFEKDLVGKEDVTGEVAKLLDMQSEATG
jgi:aurora kinase